MNSDVIEIAALVLVIACGLGMLIALGRAAWTDRRDRQFTAHVEDAERVLRHDGDPR